MTRIQNFLHFYVKYTYVLSYTSSKFQLSLSFCPQPLDRDQPAGRPQWRFTVFAQDEGGEGLVGYADVQVNLKDINDNAPTFPQGVYFGNVTENGTAGMYDCMSFESGQF